MCEAVCVSGYVYNVLYNLCYIVICKTCTNYQNCCKEKLLTVHTWIVIFIELILSLAYRLSAPDNPVGITYKVHVVCIQVGSHSVFMEVMYLFLCCLSVCQSKFCKCGWLCYLSIFLLKEKNKKYSNDFSTWHSFEERKGQLVISNHL